jgi:hypothetical protein
VLATILIGDAPRLQLIVLGILSRILLVVCACYDLADKCRILHIRAT